MPQVQFPGTEITRYRDKKARNPSLVGLLAEGDSWFSFPQWLRTNALNELIRRNAGEAAWFTATQSGDEARAMLCHESYEYLVRILHREKLTFDGILFSGGGNDFVGPSMLSLLKDFQTGMTWQECLHEERIERRFRQIEDAYEELAALRDDYQPQARIFTHGYDFAQTNGKPVKVLFLNVGPWIEKAMDKKGITHEQDQQNIVDHLLKKFDQLQTELESRHTHWKYIRTQGTLAPSDWEDEIHPTTDGFIKIADKFQSALSSVFLNLRK